MALRDDSLAFFLGGAGRCEKIELAFIRRAPPFPRGDYGGVAGFLFQALIQHWKPPPSSPPLEKGGQPKVAVLIIDKHIFSQLLTHDKMG